MPRQSECYCLVCGSIGWVLNNYVRQRGQGYVLTNDPGILLERNPDTLRGPDVVLFDHARKYGDFNPKFTEGVPPLAVEVLSPTDRIGKVTRRLTQFLQAGMRLVWLVDPNARDVTVCRPGKDPYVVEEGQELTGDDICRTCAAWWPTSSSRLGVSVDMRSGTGQTSHAELKTRPLSRRNSSAQW